MNTLSSPVRNVLGQLRESAEKAYPFLPEPSFRYGLEIMLHVTGLSLDAVAPQKPRTLATLELPDGVTATPLADVKESETFGKLFPPENSKLAAFHYRNLADGWLIQVKPGVEIKEPILLRNPFVGPSTFDHLVIEVGEGSTVSFVEDIYGTDLGNFLFRSNVIEIRLASAANATFTTFQRLEDNVHNMVFKRAVLEQDASLSWFACDTGSKIARVDQATLLEGKGSRTTNLNVFAGAGAQSLDHHIAAIHRGTDTFSDIRSRGALLDKAKAIARGTIKIERLAVRSNGYQKEDILLLSEDAEADPVPILEIDNNDVKCGHASTVGQLDREKLFYLQSRGIPEEVALQLIIEGFFETATALFPEALRDFARAVVNDKLGIREGAYV